MLKEKLQQCCWSWIRLLLITTNCSSLENHVHEGWTKFGGSEPGQVTHCLFMAAAYSKVIKEAHLLGLQSSASLPAEEGRNYMSSPFSHHLAGLWGKMFKRLSLRLIYDLSNDSWYCNETPPPLLVCKFTHASGSLLGHWSLSVEISLPDCVLNVLICFLR